MTSRNKREGYYMGHNNGWTRKKPKHWRTGNKKYYTSLKDLSQQWKEVVKAFERCCK